MLDQIHFGSTVGIPKVDREDIIGCINLTNPGGSATFLSIARISTRVCILDINLLPGLLILYDQTNAWRGGDWSPVLEEKQVSRKFVNMPETKRRPTLSPKPHIRARMGCCTTCNDQIRPLCLAENGAR